MSQITAYQGHELHSSLLHSAISQILAIQSACLSTKMLSCIIHLISVSAAPSVT